MISKINNVACAVTATNVNSEHLFVRTFDSQKSTHEDSLRVMGYGL
jgi:hypothetical protein